MNSDLVEWLDALVPKPGGLAELATVEKVSGSGALRLCVLRGLDALETEVAPPPKRPAKGPTKPQDGTRWPEPAPGEGSSMARRTRTKPKRTALKGRRPGHVFDPEGPEDLNHGVAALWAALRVPEVMALCGMDVDLRRLATYERSERAIRGPLDWGDDDMGP